MDEFETYIRTELGLSQETLRAYSRDVREFLDFIGEQELTAQLIEMFLSHLQHNGLKPTTIRRKCMSIRCLCHHLISLGSLDQNILKMIDSVRADKGIPNALDSKSVDNLISTVENRTPILRTNNIRRDVAIILTIYHSGLRASELCGLNIGDINFNRRTILVKGKGGRERIVPTTPRCVETIRSYLDQDRISDTDAVFVNHSGQRITRRAVSDMLVSVSCRAGVGHTTAHVLRRSCATSLMNRGVDLELVQILLGHQCLSTTQTYLAVSYDRLAKAHRLYHPFGDKSEI